MSAAITSDPKKWSQFLPTQARAITVPQGPGCPESAAGMRQYAPLHHSRRSAAILIVAALCSSVAARAKTTDTMRHNLSDRQPRSAHWSLSEKNGFELELIQRPMDLTQAFFQGRGLSPDVTQRITNACVMAVVARNLSANRTLRINLADWRVISDSHEQPLRLEADWQKEWKNDAVSPPARIAFRYSMLPTIQSLRPGDWMQGMITTNLNPGQRFDLHVRWTENGKTKQAWLRDVVCAPPSSEETQP
ncbi:MAG: hypothetical protein ACYDDO_02465 [Acidiferrobacterales bacterium]